MELSGHARRRIAPMRGEILTAEEFDLAVDQALRNGGTPTPEAMYEAISTLAQRKCEHEEWLRWKNGESEVRLERWRKADAE